MPGTSSTCCQRAPAGQLPQILLKEGMDTSQVRGQMLSNINTCTAVADTVRTTLGRRGMDKLIHDDKGTTISNDGATIIRLLDIIHPAAKILVDIAKSQDSEVIHSSACFTVSRCCCYSSNNVLSVLSLMHFWCIRV
jgi:hypothetical protein